MRSAVVKVPNVVGFRRFQAARGLNMPRFLALALLALFSTVFAVPELWAGGRRSVDTVTAEGEETWQNRFDVREYSRGTHNFIVHARDRAGNVSVSGPYNIVVDPNAALPVVRIVYPVENAIVRQDISVIGVASGRYGIERVLLSLNDDEDETVTNGTDYWDQVLDFSDLPDGRHTLHVRALDGGGLYGPVSSVSFILDRLPPAIELDSHAVGDIISGNVVIRGHATDASGIRRMYISYDGYDFRPLQTRVRRGAPEHEFSFPIRTKDFPDGSIVHHLRAVDNTGLVTVSPVMFFISNTPPTLEILSPLMYEHQYNSFMVSGRAHSTVGIARVYYQWGRGRGEIEVRPGDPYWHAILEQASGSGNTITVTAVDNAGNIVRASHRLDDRSRDRLPVLVIDYPPAYVLANMPANVAIYGRIETAAGFASVQVGTEMIDAFPSFRIDPDMIPIGRNMNLRLGPIADGGGRGAITTLRVTRLVDYYAPPVVPSRNLTVTSPALGAWVTGGSVSIEGSAARGARVEFRLAPWEDWQNLVLDEDGGFARSVSMAGREPGPVHLELRTGTDFPVYHPFTVAVAARESPRLRWVTPSLESDPELPPRLVRGNRTVIAELEYAVPIISVAVGHSLAAGQVDPDDPEAGDGFTEIPFFSCSGRTWFTYFSDFTTLTADDGTLVFRIKDATGSYFVTAPAYVMDPDPPIPILLVNSPTDNEVFTTDFELSGIAFDDVGIRGIYWRILGPTIESISPGEAGDFARAAAEAFAENPDVEFNLYLTERSFGIPIDFSMITDGEYIIEMFASDIYGVRSEVVSRTVRISTEPPYTRILYPLITHYNNRTIIVRGFSIDANGIDSVLFSMDGGNTWQDVLLEEDGHWEISLNTTLYTDGLNSALIQAVDGYGISSFTIAMINIDNSAPELHLTSPASGQNVGTDLEFMGRVADNMGLYSLTFQVISAENPEYRLDREITPESSVIFESMSLDGFAPGDYIVRVIARDLAGNETIISREITLGGGDAEIAIFNPFPGEVISGPVNVVGTVTGEYMPESVVLLMNGDRIADVPVDRFGTFSYDIPYELLRDGQAHGISVYFDLVTGERILSPVHTVFYYRFGPVLTIESHQDGDVITRRPWLSGRAWMSADDDWGEYYDRAERRATERAMALASVQVSYDNGHTFMNARSGRGGDWRFRLETGELAAGHLPILVRAQFVNGEQAVRRVMLYVDTTPPFIQTITPLERSAHRESVLIYGIASDNNNLASVDISLRTGDKWLYSVPAFLQGAYFDFKGFGAVYFEVGFGLSLFDDNVRLQVQYGRAPGGLQSTLVTGGRYPGHVVGARLLANVFSLPFSWLLGPDWAFYSMNFAVGANFSWFSMDDGRDPLFMTAVIGQWDIANVNMQEIFPDWRRFRNFALYLQPELWFAPSDVQGPETMIFRIGVGLRMNLF